jgi:hypothetical protein
MSDIYVMQRANGDVFAVDHQGRFRVPLFRSSAEAMIARSRKVEMLLFKPVALDAPLLSELVTESGGTDVDLWLVEDPLHSLKGGRLMEHAQLALLMRGPSEQTVLVNGNDSDVPVLGAFPQSGRGSTEIRKDEEGNYSKCA